MLRCIGCPRRQCAFCGCAQIWQWTRDFCERTKATGQLCFDFMKSGEDGQLYAFECNPRASTILLNFYNHPAFARALYDGKVCICGATEAKGFKPLVQAVLLIVGIGSLFKAFFPREPCMQLSPHVACGACSLHADRASSVPCMHP